DEALRINPRKFPLNANANKVRVLAIILNPPLNLLFVRERNAAGVDLNRIPAMCEPAKVKALSEPALIPCGVSEAAPNDLRVFVRERALGGLPNHIGNCRGLIEDHQNPLALVMQSGERLSVPLRPRHHVDPPSLFMVRV